MAKPLNVIEMNLTPVKAKDIILDVLRDTSRMVITEHAEKRMKERNISRTQILRCLKTCHITEGPSRGIKGNWEMTMTTLSAGDPVTVVAALDRDEAGNYIIIITVYH